MRTSTIGRRVAVTSLIVAVFASALPAGSPAAGSKKGPKPTVATGRALHVRATSAVLTGTVDPRGAVTSYAFQYGPSTGPTPSYGAQTALTPVGTAKEKLKVSQTITGLTPGVAYNYRIIAVYSATLPPVLGANHKFTPKGGALRFELPKSHWRWRECPSCSRARSAASAAAAARSCCRRAPTPTSKPFPTRRSPRRDEPAGAFSFRIANLARNTQLRVVTLGPAADLQPGRDRAGRVRSHAPRAPSRERPGAHLRHRDPAVTGARVRMQLQKAVRPGRKKRHALRDAVHRQDAARDEPLLALQHVVSRPARATTALRRSHRGTSSRAARAAHRANRRARHEARALGHRGARPALRGRGPRCRRALGARARQAARGEQLDHPLDLLLDRFALRRAPGRARLGAS